MPQKARKKLADMAVDLSRAGETEAAMRAFRRALKRHPRDPNILNDIGVTLAKIGRHEEAKSNFYRALDANPDFAEVHQNLGLTLTKLGYYMSAEVHLSRCIALSPKNANAYHSRAVARLYRGFWSGASDDYDKCLMLDPGNADAHRDRAYFRLLMGDLQRGFSEYHWRYRTEEMKHNGTIPPEEKLWDGCDFSGRILIRAEQGLGDTIQFVRYLPGVKACGNPHITLVVKPELISIIERTGWADEIVSAGGGHARFERWASLLDLPGIMGTELGNIPAATPYLVPRHELVTQWRSRITTTHSALNIGLRWRGSSTHARDRERSFGSEMFKPLLSVPGCQFFSLQTMTGTKTLDGMAEWGADFDLASFEDAAAACCALDLIISVDTSMVHLAGALGRPVWNLVSYVPDWRWMLNRSDSPWYPTMRLFRQPSPGDWESVIQEVRDQLHLLAGRIKRHRENEQVV